MGDNAFHVSAQAEQPTTELEKSLHVLLPAQLDILAQLLLDELAPYVVDELVTSMCCCLLSGLSGISMVASCML